LPDRLIKPQTPDLWKWSGEVAFSMKGRDGAGQAKLWAFTGALSEAAMQYPFQRSGV
jgi:hypothetical protein